MSGQEELSEQLKHALSDLEAAGEEWLEVRAAGKDTGKQEAAIREAERTTRRLERKLRKIEKKKRTQPTKEGTP